MKVGKKIIFLIFLLSFGAISSGAHPFYVSICQIDFNRESHSLEISVKIFANDLLLGLEDNGAKNLYLGEEKENLKTDQFIFDYIVSKLNFKVNGEVVNFSFIGKEMETDAVWSYMEIKNISALNEIEVECNLLTELFPTQSNIIQINNGEEIKNLLLNKQKTIDSITY